MNASAGKRTALDKCIRYGHRYREEMERGGKLVTDSTIKNYDNCLDMLLEAGAEIQVSDLNTAARCGDIEFLQKLVVAGAHVNRTSSDGCLPLTSAVISNREDCVNIVLEAGADPNCLPPGQWTPLAEAVTWRRHCVKSLLNAGANVNAVVNQDGQTVLFFSSYMLHDDTDNVCGATVLQLLLETGADVNIKDSDGQSPLVY